MVCEYSTSGSSANPELVDAILQCLNESDWQIQARRDGVTVYTSPSPDNPYLGFRTVTVIHAAYRKVVAFLGSNLFDAMSGMNRRYIEGGVVDLPSSTVRTAFRMPPGMRNRDFVHSLGIHEVNPGTTVVAYGPKPPGLFPVKNYVRCPMFPSGQRISRLENGRVRVEHLMVYGLGGAVTPFVQNHLFRRAHIRAYLDEWTRLGELIRDDIVEFGHA